MKTAIAAQTGTTDSLIDKHFGKCSYFIIYNDVDDTTEVIPNPGKGLQGCKGEAIVRELTDHQVQRVIAGDFGTNVQQILSKHHIQMILHPEAGTKISEIIQILQQH